MPLYWPIFINSLQSLRGRKFARFTVLMQYVIHMQAQVLSSNKTVKRRDDYYYQLKFKHNSCL
jgi:hypothetical protein